MTVVNTTTGEIIDCTEAEAIEITQRIKDAAESIWSLLLEAHERRAWVALGYATWELYVRAEFDMARAHSYRLLDQARVIREIESVSPMGDIAGSISERMARDLKPVIDEVKTDLTAEIDALPDPTPEQINVTVNNVLNRRREQVRGPKAKPAVTPEPSVADVIDTARNTPSHQAGKAVEQLLAIRKFIQKIGGPSAIVADLDGDSGRDLAALWLPTIESTCEVLDDFRQRLRRKHLRGVK